MKPVTQLYVVLVAMICVTHPSRASNGVPLPDHVVIVVEENRSDTDVYGRAEFPYFNSLANNTSGVATAKFTNYGGVSHPSQPNYIAMFSGQTFGISDDSVHPFSTFAAPAATNLAAKLLAAGKSFAGYSEDLPSVGSQVSSSGKYRRKHNPWANWQDALIPDSHELPASINRPFAGAGNWPAGDFSQLPALSIVVPNQDNDGHDTSDQTCDTWLVNKIRSYADWTMTHNSLLIVTWDEDEGTGRIATTFSGPMVKAGVYGESTNHYGLLRTLEEMYGLSHDTANTQAATTITDVWATVPEPDSACVCATGAALACMRRLKRRR